jgi:plastocyanin
MLFVRQLVQPLLASLVLVTVVSASDVSSLSATATSNTVTSASSTTSTGKATHTIQVGPKSDPHQYVPANITANVGDTVVFEFYPTNHSVVQADYLAPCVPASGNIFYSGAFAKFNEQGGQLVGPVSKKP